MSGTPRPIVLEPGQFLMLQGRPSESFYVLKSGVLEALINDEDAVPSEEHVASSGRRISVMNKANLPIGEIGAIEKSARTASVRAVEKSELMEVPGGADAVVKWIKTNYQAGFHIAKTLTDRAVYSHGRWHSVRMLAQRMDIYRKNLSMVYSVFHSAEIEPLAAFETFAREGRNYIKSLDQKTPPSIANFERNIESMEPPPPLQKPFPQIEQIYFHRGLLSQDKKDLQWLSNTALRPHGLEYLAATAATALTRMSNELQTEMKKTEPVIGGMYAEIGIVNAFIVLYTHSEADMREALRPYLSRILTFTKVEFEALSELWGETFPNRRELYECMILLEDIAKGKEIESSFIIEEDALPIASQTTAVAAPPKSGDTLPPKRAAVAMHAKTFNLREIVDALTLTEVERIAFEICTGAKPSESPSVAYKAYWQIYPKMWQAANRLEVPELIAFVRYGACPPGPFKLPAAYNLAPAGQGPVMYADQWLKRIYENESAPSRDELGQSLEDWLRTKKAERYKPEETDPAMDNVHWEIEQMISRATRAFSGGRGELVTLRRTPEELESLADKMLTTKSVAENLIKLVKLDFSAFYRDVRVSLEERSEFLPADVIPFFIILPGGGDRSLSWQEFEGRAKETPGRLVLPVISDSDTFDLIIQCVGRFRWNIAKEIAGSNWMSPVEGGLTGRYFDYITYFKKNTELSDEAKIKIKEVFTGISLDVEKFLVDYRQWIMFESAGVQRLNRVARRIFCESCPFSMEVRKKLGRNPAFGKILDSDSTKRLKKQKELERRIYSLERKGVSIGKSFDAALKLYQPIPE